MRTSHGFTLIEMAIVLIILGVVVTILIPPIVTSIQHEKRQEGKDALTSLRHALVGHVRETETKTLPATLPAELPQHDIWTRKYVYRPAFNATINICNPEVSTDDGKLEMRLNATATIKPAFLIASRGHYTGGNDDVDYNATFIDLADRKDDIIEFMSLDHLRYMVCGASADDGTGEAMGYAIVGKNSIAVGHNSQITGNVGSNSGSVTLNSRARVDGHVNAFLQVTLISASHVTGDILAGGEVLLNTGSTVGGDVHTTGNVIVGHTAVVNGNVYAGGSVTVDGEVRGNIYAHGAVTISYNGKVLGNIISVGNITVNNTAANPSIAGNLESKNNITLLWGAKVGGNVSAGGTVNKNNDALVAGTISQGVPTSTPPAAKQPESTALPELQDFSSTGSDVTPSDGVILPPGNYGAVNIGWNRTVTLKGGQYVFKTLSLADSTTLKFDFSNDQDILIFVENNVAINSGFSQLLSTDGADYTPPATAPHDIAKRIHLETKGSFSLASQAKWMGTVLTENNLLVGDNGLFVGQAVSRGSLTLPSTVTYVYMPSNFSKSHW